VGRPFSGRLAVFGPVNRPALGGLSPAGKPFQAAALLQGFVKLGSERCASACRAVRTWPGRGDGQKWISIRGGCLRESAADSVGRARSA
jgi:hypothetical protein